MPPIDPSALKETYLQDNEYLTELELTEESKAIGNLQDIDLLDNEVWLLQCPRGMDIKDLERQKLKMPGRTNFNDSEAVSMEFTEGKEQRAFAYCNRKGRYALRLLPVRGTIVVRDRLKAAETVTTERAEECCPAAKRVPLPSNIRVRHPLLGVQYEEKLVLEKAIKKRLQKADEVSATILKDNLAKKMESSLRTVVSKKLNSKTSLEAIEINSGDEDDDDAVEFISVEKSKKKKNKRKNTDTLNEEDLDIKDVSATKKKKSKKSKKDEEIVSKDLQWLQNI